MRRSELRNDIHSAVPPMPESFMNAITTTLNDIAPITPSVAKDKPVMGRRRMLVYALAAMLLIGTAAAGALLKLNLFETTIGTTPTNAADFVKYDLANVKVGNADITVEEAAYDGMSLYVAYSIRDGSAAESLGILDEESGQQMLESLNVGSWSDSLWIDGDHISMPGMSSTISVGSETAGEIVFYHMYRLDQENVFLMGSDVEISLPIGERQEYGSLDINEDGVMSKPEQGVVTFSLDCTQTDQIQMIEPQIMMEGTRWSAQVSQYMISPLQMYVTLDWEINPDLMAAYIEENGDGFYQDGIKYYDYDGLEVVGREIMGLKLVDENGKPVYEGMEGRYGCGGASVSAAYYTFPYMETYPEHMYLAPLVEGQVDMTHAITLR